MRGSGENTVKSIRLVGVGFLLAGALIPAMLVGYTDAAQHAPAGGGAGGRSGTGGIVAEEQAGKKVIKVNGQTAPWMGAPAAKKQASGVGTPLNTDAQTPATPDSTNPSIPATAPTPGP
jgi:hypothetical protein